MYKMTLPTKRGSGGQKSPKHSPHLVITGKLILNILSIDINWSFLKSKMPGISA